MPEFINTLSQKLTGFDLWFALILIGIGSAGWYYFGQTKKVEQKTARRQIGFAVLIFLVGIAGIGANHLFFDSDFTFPKDVAGIWVLRIEGDDENNSLQRLLVSSLNNSIRKEVTGQKIEIRAHNEAVSEAMGLAQAHTKAREIGKAGKAILVIWGNRVGDKTFFPRLTVVERKQSSTSGQWTLAAQDISELALPTAQVDRPIYLKHFVTGYAFYDRDNYAAALAEFKAALNQSVINPVELNEIRVFCGRSHDALAEGQKDMASQLQQAIAYYDTALSFYTEKNFPEQWTWAQRNLGDAYLDLHTGERNINLQKAITCYEAALRGYTEKEFPEEWAHIQNNLGAAYWWLPIGDESKNRQKTKVFFQAALRVSNERDFPELLALIHRNLGVTKLGDGDGSKDLQKAIAFDGAALRIYAEKNFPKKWASIQQGLGRAYSSLVTGDRIQNLKKAIAFYEAALRVYTEEAFPVYWADTQNYLGDVYSDSLMIANNKENLQKAIAYYQAALRVYTEKDFPEDWARTQKNLGEAYATGLTNANAYAGIVSALLTGARGDSNLSINLPKAIAAYEAALRVYTEKDYPEKWAEVQSRLGVANVFLAVGERSDNLLKKAIAASEAALHVYTEKDSPDEWGAIKVILGYAYAVSSSFGDQTANAQKAIAASEAGLRVYIENNSRAERVWAQVMLGSVYLTLASDDPHRYANKAIAACEEALRICAENDSVLWAYSQFQLAIAYGSLASGDSNTKANKAIAAFEAAQRVFTEKAYPVYWVITQMGLGWIYKDELSTGSRSHNLKKAIAYFESVLKSEADKTIPDLHPEEIVDMLKDAQIELRDLEKK